MKKSNLELERDRIIEELSKLHPSDGLYDKTVKQLVEIEKALAIDRNSRAKGRIDPATVFQQVCWFIGIGVLMFFESSGHIFTSKLSNSIFRRP